MTTNQMTLRTAVALAGAVALCLPAPADVMLTADGRLIKDLTMERHEDHVLIHFENGDVKVPLDQVEELFLDADLENLPSSRKNWLKKRLKEREEELHANLEHAVWRNAYQEETDTFDWTYTLAKPIGESLQVRFEEYYDHFKKRWRLKRDKRVAKMPVNFYRNSTQYTRVSGAPPSALAYWLVIPPYDLNACWDRLDPKGAEMTLYHELQHYVQRMLNDEFDMPHWPGEGAAEYYSGALWNEETEEFDWNLIHEGRLVEVLQDISLGRMKSIRDIVTKPDYTDYTWGWALIYFFYQEGDLGEKFEDYFVGLARDRKVKRIPSSFGLVTVSPEESLRYFMESMDLDDQEELEALQDRFYEFLQKDMELKSASALERAAIGARRFGKPIRAERLFKEAEAAGGLSAVGCHEFAQLIDYKDKKKAIELYERACELAPLEATYWYWRGLLVEANNEEEGQRMQALAKEIDPEIDDLIIQIDFKTTEFSGEDE